MNFLSVSPEIPLDANNNLIDERFTSIRDFNEKFRHILKFPVPVCRHAFETVIDPYPPVDTEEDLGTFSFTIAGYKFTTRNNPYTRATKFDISFTRGQFMTTTMFKRLFVYPMVNRWRRKSINFSAICSEHNARLIRFGTPQIAIGIITSKEDVQMQFETSVMTACQDTVTDSKNSPGFEQYRTFMTQKSLTVRLISKEPAPIITPIFTKQKDLRYMGINTIPDYCAGFETRINGCSQVIKATCLGALKRPNYLLAATFNKIADSIRNENQECQFDPNGSPVSVNYLGLNVDTADYLLDQKVTSILLDDFKLVLIKITTEAVNAGIRKLFISDYDNIIFVELDSQFEVVGRSEFKNSTEHIIPNLKFYIINTVTTEFPRLFLTAFLSRRPSDSRKDRIFSERVLTFLTGQRSRDRAANVPAQMVQPEEVATTTEPRATTTQRLQNQQFQQNLILQQLARESGQSVSSSLPSSTPNFSGQLMGDETQITDTYGTTKRRFHLNPKLFAMEYRISLEEVVLKFLHFGTFWSASVLPDSVSHLKSQVMLVDLNLFFTNLNQENVFESDCDNCVLKVFDCSWSLNSEAKYQHAIDAVLKEIQIYQLIEHLGITPKIIAYGRLIDDTVSVGKPYIRCSGPFILKTKLEKLEVTKNQVTKSMLDTVVKPVFKMLHKRGIVFNNISMENFMFEESGGFKLLDLANCIMSSKEDDYKSEISKLYNYFGFQE